MVDMHIDKCKWVLQSTIYSLQNSNCSTRPFSVESNTKFYFSIFLFIKTVFNMLSTVIIMDSIRRDKLRFFSRSAKSLLKRLTSAMSPAGLIIIENGPEDTPKWIETKTAQRSHLLVDRVVGVGLLELWAPVWDKIRCWVVFFSGNSNNNNILYFSRNHSRIHRVK